MERFVKRVDNLSKLALWDRVESSLPLVLYVAALEVGQLVSTGFAEVARILARGVFARA